MPVYRATPSAEKRLVETNESGIGFQILRYRGDFFVALNATILVPLRALREEPLITDQLTALLAEGPGVESNLAEPFELGNDFTLAFSQLERQYRDPGTGLNIQEIAAAPPENVISPKRPYSYYRFSAAPRDKRIGPNGDFFPGTYATTYADFHFVPSGFAAVGIKPSRIQLRSVCISDNHIRPPDQNGNRHAKLRASWRRRRGSVRPRSEERSRPQLHDRRWIITGLSATSFVSILRATNLGPYLFRARFLAVPSIVCRACHL